jgi:glycine cleavage system transcriptional repressor
MSTSPVPAPQLAILSTIGPDGPGLVAALTQGITQVGGNIEDSTMTRLAGQFAMILSLSLPSPAALQALQAFCHTLQSSHGLVSQLHPVDRLTPLPAPAGQRQLLLSVAGRDRTGITQQVSQLLAVHHANITELTAHRINGHEGPVYILVLEVAVPAAAVALEAELEALGAQLGLEVRIKSVDPIAL